MTKYFAWHRSMPCSRSSPSPRTGKDEGFVGIAESLRKHHHHNGYLDVGSIDTHHRAGCLLLAAEKVWDENLTHVLAEDSRHSEHKQRPAIDKHAAQEGASNCTRRPVSSGIRQRSTTADEMRFARNIHPIPKPAPPSGS